MSYNIEIFSHHEVTRDLVTILGNSSKDKFVITPNSLSEWLSIQKKFFTSWDDLYCYVNDVDNTFSIGESIFAENGRIICHVTLKP